MNEIWANRLVAETQIWDHVPDSRKPAIKKVLAKRVKNGLITATQYETITGEVYRA